MYLPAWRLWTLSTLLWFGSSAQAHLLNMTRVTVSVDAAGALQVDMQVDLMRSMDSALAYYELSQIRQPQNDPRYQALFARLTEAIAVTLDEQIITLKLRSTQPPQASRQEFLDPFAWPMTEVHLTGSLPALSPNMPHALRARFKSSFRFEEPIAVTLQTSADQRSLTRWLIADQLSPTLALNTSTANDAQPDESWLRYVGFGFTHILPQGLDHMLFVLGLYFGARSLKSLLLLVTAFTVAHSLTLALAALGIARAPSAVVEPLIALSIIWIGVENLFAPNTNRWRVPVVFCFGLLHGLGFASALTELNLPQGDFLLALLGFNIGIELGQLTVIALAALLTLWFYQRNWYRQRIVIPACAAIALIAAMWTVQRIWQ